MLGSLSKVAGSLFSRRGLVYRNIFGYLGLRRDQSAWNCRLVHPYQFCVARYSEFSISEHHEMGLVNTEYPPSIRALHNFSIEEFFSRFPDEQGIRLLEKVISEYPSDSYTYILKAGSFRLQGDFQNALKTIDHALVLFSNCNELLNEKINIYINMNKYELALVEIDELLKREPKNVKTLKLKLFCSISLYQWEDVFFCARRILEVDNKFDLLTFGALVEAAANLKDIYSLEQAIGRVLSIEEVPISVLCRFAQLYMRLGSYEKALEVFSKSLTKLRSLLKREIEQYECIDVYTVMENVELNSLYSTPELFELFILNSQTGFSFSLYQNSSRGVSTTKNRRVSFYNLAACHTKKQFIEYLIRSKNRLFLAIANIYFSMETCYHALNDYGGLLSLSEEFLLVFPQSSMGLQQRTLSLYFLGRYQEALDTSRYCLKLFPERVEFWIYKAQALFVMNYVDEAFSTLNDAEVEFPSNPSIFRKRVLFLEQRGDYERALEEIQKYLSLSSQPDFEIELYKIIMEHKLKRYSDALKSVNDSLERFPNNYELLSQKLIILTAMKDFEQILAIASQALECYPNDVAFLKDIFYAYAGLGANEQACETLMKLIDIEGHCYAYHYNMSLLKCSLGELDQAHEHINIELEKYPNAASWSLKGSILKRLKNYPDAIQCLEKAIEFTHDEKNREALQKEIQLLREKIE